MPPVSKYWALAAKVRNSITMTKKNTGLFILFPFEVS
jgi:hypothetical protein